MPLQLDATALARRLEKLSDDLTHSSNAKLYLGAVESLLNDVPKLLARIVNTFPHYTSHAVDHSITIIDRVGRCLPKKTLNALTPTEIYIIIAGAFLHDIGMLVSERDYANIEGQESFKALHDDRRFLPFFEAAEQAEKDGQLWPAAFNRRYLIAEWVRRRHADRSADFVLDLPPELAAAKCNDPHVTEAIAKVCRAHGFTNRLLLEDEGEFPRACIIRDDEVDLAFCAVLLRLGDLLDLGSERACPLVRNIAEPLPGDSDVHWGRHKAVRPPTITETKIKITGRCDNQEEHAILHSWCEWLRDEVVYCPALIAHSDRFTMKLGVPEIDIRPKVAGSYEFRQYRFELDHEEIFDKLFGERLYGNRSLFVRELIQNAIDATRCKLMDDINRGEHDKELGVAEPAQRPTEPRAIPLDIRRRYPIRVSLRRDGEESQKLTVEDQGIGMDHESVRNYLLKAGRSYYRSAVFKSRYRFRPISEFGIGLLSCFMAADNIEIETRRAGSDDGPIHLTIPPWRQYILTRPGTRPTSGTAITLRLHSGEWLSENPYADFLKMDNELGRTVPSSDFGALVQSMVRHVEFPIEWSDEEDGGVLEDTWEEALNGENWVETGGDKWARSVSLPEIGAVARVHFGRFIFANNGLALSKEGIAVSVYASADEDSAFRRDVDFRGPHSPALTVDRLRFVDEMLEKGLLASGFDSLSDDATIQLLGDPGSPLVAVTARHVLYYYGSPSIRDKIEKIRLHLLRVWIWHDGQPTFCSLAEAVRLVPGKVSIKLESAPNLGAGECTTPEDIVFPLVNSDANIRVDTLGFWMALKFFRERIKSVNGHQFSNFTYLLDKPTDRLILSFAIDIGQWSAVSLGVNFWVLSGALVKRLLEYQAVVNLPLEPLGDWDRWGPTIFPASNVTYDYPWATQPPSLPPGPWRHLRGAAYLMHTLRQHVHDLPADFITDADISPEDRARGLPYEFGQWLEEGLVSLQPEESD